MKVSIIVPIYKVERYLKLCVKSLLEQTYTDIEYIFVNDCTPDNSMEILHTLLNNPMYRSKDVKIINHKYNQGLSCARYTGIINSSGDYIYHIDSDDWLNKDTIQYLVEAVMQTHTDMVVGQMTLEFNDLTIKTSTITPSNQEEYILQMLIRNRKYPWNLCNRLIKRDLQMTIMPERGLDMGEDYATVPRLCALANKVYFEERAIYHYRQNNSSSYTKNISYKSYTDLISASEILCAFFENNNKFPLIKKAIPTIKLKTKASCYLIANHEIRKENRNIYTTETDYSNLTLSERILLHLGNLKLWLLMDIYVKLGLYIKHALKQIKNS